MQIFSLFPFLVAPLTVDTIILHSLLSRIPNPHFLLYSPTYSLRWVEVLWLFIDFTRVDGGPIPSFLSGCFIGNGGNGIRTSSYLQKAIQQWYSPRQYWATETLYPREITRGAHHERPRQNGLITCFGLRLGLNKCLDQDHKSSRRRVKYYTTRLGSKA